ncbi:MAG TPA: cation diffusion facilitator family transporter [Longimicrobiaceae bacterium]|nr:cation diffusion facilitator family transporter [Longimicrobiaceae bacterium]
MSRTPVSERSSLTRYAWLAIAAAVTTIGLKGGAYLLTGSVGLLSDAVESVVNLAAATMALGMLVVAASPPDEEHAYGHNKAEYFASGFEGALILVAAVGIGWVALQRLLDPRPLEAVGLGLVISVLAALVNLAVARVLFRAGRQHDSITLEADAHHLMTDVWTSGGVLLGVGLAELTGWDRLDPLMALFVALNIVRMGVDLLRRSALGLLDTAIPEEERTVIDAVLAGHMRHGVKYHALRTRRAGARRFVSLHVLVPGTWSVQQGHHLLEEIEEEIRAALPASTVFTHLEPLEDPVSWDDVHLDRSRQPGS